MGKESSPRAEGRVAGAGAGTGLIGIIAYIPDSYSALKQVLTYAAPSITVVVGWGWILCRVKLSRWMTERELKKAISKAEKIRDTILSNGASTPTDKKNARQAVADLNALQLAGLREHYERVKADLTPD